jgi:ABC-2 type transport system permease protein
VWFRSVYLKTLRDLRWRILAWGLGMGLTIVSPMASVATLISTPAQRAALAGIAAQFAWNASAVAVTTIGGYATFKIGTFVFLVCLFPLLSATAMLRGEEERGSLDVLLSAPESRVSVALQKVAALWTALLLVGVISGVVAYLGGVLFKGDFSPGDGQLWGLNLALICMVFGGIALLISQFTQERRTAAGATGALLVVLIVVDMVHRIYPDAEWFSKLSPIYYYNLSKPIVPSYGTSVGGMLVMLAISAVLTSAAIWLFVRRDIKDVVQLPWAARFARPSEPSKELPVRDWSLGSVYTRSLGQLAAATFWWSAGFAAFAVWMLVAVEQLSKQLTTLLEAGPNSLAVKVLQNIGGGTSLNELLLGAMFELLPVLLMAFAVTQVSRWANDADEGRLELVLATPNSRANVLLGRFAALATATVLVGVVTLLAGAAAAAAAGVSLDMAYFAEATLGMIPLGLLIAAIGYLAAGWLRTAADTGLISFLLAAWFFISFVGPDLKWPDATLRLSPFYYYGTPLLHGLQFGNVALIVVIGAVTLGLAVYRFGRKDMLPG